MVIKYKLKKNYKINLMETCLNTNTEDKQKDNQLIDHKMQVLIF